MTIAVPKRGITLPALIARAGVHVHEGGDFGSKPGRTYRVLTPPSVLRRAARSFEGRYLLDNHIHLTGDNWDAGARRHNIGVVNNCFMFKNDYLAANVHVCSGKAILELANDIKRQLSIGYSAKVKWKPGTWRGQQYDGVITSLRGNHVALAYKGKGGASIAIDTKEIRKMLIGDKSYPINCDSVTPEFRLALANDRARRLAKDQGGLRKDLSPEERERAERVGRLDFKSAGATRNQASKTNSGQKEPPSSTPQSTNVDWQGFKDRYQISDDDFEELMSHMRKNDDEMPPESELESEETPPQETEEEVASPFVEAEDDPPPFKGRPRPGGGMDARLRHLGIDEKFIKDVRRIRHGHNYGVAASVQLTDGGKPSKKTEAEKMRNFRALANDAKIFVANAKNAGSTFDRFPDLKRIRGV